MAHTRAGEPWRGSVFLPSGRTHLHLKVRIGGEWRKVATPYLPAEREAAERHLAEVREAILARESAIGGEAGPVTVRAWARAWLKTRPDRFGDDARNLRLHILPAIGDLMLAEVSTRQIRDMVRGWGYDEDDPEAPGGRTVGNWYSTARALFRDAAIEGLIQASPCILTAPHVPPRLDKDSEWRASATFSLAELERLLTPNPAIEADSLVSYALLGLGAVRHGELAALRWRHLDTDREPLGSILVANSNGRRRTKKARTRLMPIHPTLAAILADWRLAGWPALIGRAPGPDDLILPLPPQPPTGRRVTGKRPELQDTPETRRRTHDVTWKRLDRHLEVLGLRHRRVHDLRRTFLTLAEAAGAERAILGWGTHGRAGDVLSAYTDPDWRRLCNEVAKLQLRRPKGGGRRVVPLRRGRP